MIFIGFTDIYLLLKTSIVLKIK